MATFGQGISLLSVQTIVGAVNTNVSIPSGSYGKLSVITMLAGNQIGYNGPAVYTAPGTVAGIEFLFAPGTLTLTGNFTLAVFKNT